MNQYIYNPEIEDQRKPLFNVLLDLLDTFKDFCDRHDLTYFAVGGTLLGAVRHSGFIPWDDDIDLGMMRKDYDRLLELIETETLPNPYRFLTPLTDPGYARGQIRLTNVNTTAISAKTARYNFNKGIFIDIFPVDSVPDDEKKLFVLKKKLIAYSYLNAICSRYSCKVGTIGLSRFKCGLYRLCLPLLKSGVLSTEKVFRALNKTASRYQNEPTKRVGQVTFLAEDRFIFDREIFSKIETHRFESTEISIPSGYDAFLTHQYGDYMKPSKQASYHGDIIFDVNTPYPEYIRKHKLLKRV